MAKPHHKVPKARPGPVGGKREANRRERIRSLTQAGLSLFSKQGIERVTIDEIAKEAGMAKGNFYRYFDDKAALVDAVMAPIEQSVRKAMRQCAIDLGKANTSEDTDAAYSLMAGTLAIVISQHMDELHLFLQEHRGKNAGGLGKLALSLEEGAIELTQIAVDRGLLTVSDPRVSAIAVVGAIESLAFAVLRKRLDASPIAIAQIIVKMVLEGIRKT